MRHFLLVATLGLTVCTSQRPFDPEMEVPLEEPFVLRIGQSAEVAGTPLQIRFDAVREDSRCPADVTCVWGGNARVRLTVAAEGGINPLDLNTGLEPGAASVDGYVITLEGLQPETRTTTVIQPEDYLASLRVAAEPES